MLSSPGDRPQTVFLSFVLSLARAGSAIFDRRHPRQERIQFVPSEFADPAQQRPATDHHDVKPGQCARVLTKRFPHDPLAGIAIDGSAYRLARGDDSQARARSASTQSPHDEITPAGSALLCQHGLELAATGEAGVPYAPCQKACPTT